MELNLSPEFLVTSGQVHFSWKPVLEESRVELAALEIFLSSQRAAGVQILPEPDHIFRALKLPLDQVRVVIIGQDPYPTPGHAMGLAFSAPSDVSPLPRSLTNIFKELHSDIGCEIPKNGELIKWEQQGVLLLNRILSVSAGKPNSHQNQGWEIVTLNILKLLERKSPKGFVCISWGHQARKVSSNLHKATVIESAHPSPLSANKGFFGSNPFSLTNNYLKGFGLHQIEWGLV